MISPITVEHHGNKARGQHSQAEPHQAVVARPESKARGRSSWLHENQLAVIKEQLSRSGWAVKQLAGGLLIANGSWIIDLVQFIERDAQVLVYGAVRAQKTDNGAQPHHRQQQQANEPVVAQQL